MAEHADPTRAAPQGRQRAQAQAQQVTPHVPRPPWAPTFSPAFAVTRAPGGDADAPTAETEARPASASQALAAAGLPEPPRPPNRTGLPDRLKAGVEALSGLSMEDVRVHRNSSEPAKLGALAYAQGSNVHLGPGQERHLPHEAWHVVQQIQGRVGPTTLLEGVPVNNDAGLEGEADRMGAAAAAFPEGISGRGSSAGADPRSTVAADLLVFQRAGMGTVAQLIYLWDREEQAEPQWSDEAKPPKDPPYLPQGRFKAEGHPEDNLYVRLKPEDRYYGLYFEDSEELDKNRAAIFKDKEPQNAAEMIDALDAFEGTPIVDIQTMEHLYGGAGANPNNYVEGGSNRLWALDLKARNDGLPWSDEKNEPAAFACEAAMIGTISHSGTVRFVLDGMQDLAGIVAQTGSWAQQVTAHELRFALALLTRSFKYLDGQAVKEMTAVEGTHLFFYLNRKLVRAADIGAPQPSAQSGGSSSGGPSSGGSSSGSSSGGPSSGGPSSGGPSSGL